MRACLCNLVLVLLLPLGKLPAYEREVVFDEDIKVIRFDELEYPLAARLGNVQGLVIVDVRYSEKGSVVSVEAVAGPRLLIPAALANARTWTFRPNPRGRAMIVYDFRIEQTCVLPCRSQFLFRPPNIATVRTGQALITH
jgi:hypothetical protein